MTISTIPSSKLTLNTFTPQLLALMSDVPGKGFVANITSVSKNAVTLSLALGVSVEARHDVDTTVDLKQIKRKGKLYFSEAGQVTLHEPDAPLAVKASEGSMRPMVNRF